MTLSCSCADFDKSEHERWWEPGRASVPPAGTRCCECNAPLPEGEKQQTILAGEVYEPDDATLAADPEPEETEDDDADDFDARLDAWRDRHGWDGETDRFERFTSDYRCERCADLADAIEGMGFCMLAPGDLASAHEEYVNETQELAPGVERREIIWAKGKDGVWHPRRKTAGDKRRAEIIRRWRNAKAWVRWGWRHDLRWKVWFPAQIRVMRALGYAWTYEGYDRETKKSVYRWRRQPRKLPPWEREARKGLERAP